MDEARGDAAASRINFATTEAYGRSLTDAAFWTPGVDEALRACGMAERRPVVAVAAGTFPTMLAGEGDARLVVKFLGPLFHGPECAAIEREMYALLGGAASIPVPRMLATTTLDSGSTSPWEVIVSTVMPGEAWGRRRSHGALSAADGRRAAHFLAKVTDQIAAMTPDADTTGVSSLLTDDWATFLRDQARTCVTRYREWGDLPEHLIAQLDGWIDVEALVAEGNAFRALIHGDLTADHCFGVRSADGWEPIGLIDFGDARIADRRQDLIPLYVDCFAGDRGLLDTYLAAIDQDLTVGDFPRSMLTLSVLHEFRVLGAWLDTHPAARALPTLDALAVAMWG